MALASGSTFYLEGSGLAAVAQALRDDSWLNVQWKRLGFCGPMATSLLREARWREPDLCLLVMQPQSAIARVASIRATEGRLPIVVVSSGSATDEAAVLEAGADLYCLWPAEAGILGPRIHALLRRASGTFRSAARARVELSPDALRLRVDETQVRLSVTELRVLARLELSRNKWVATSELWPLLTSAHQGYDSSRLRTHLLRLRQKLGAARWVLRTERGRGVMLTDQPSTLAQEPKPVSALGGGG